MSERGGHVVIAETGPDSERGPSGPAPQAPRAEVT
jgi:hypothetical protein